MHLTESQARRLGIHVPKRIAKRQQAEQARQLFLAACRAHGLPEPVAEFRFHQTRRWRFDWCWPDLRLALEIDGGAWTYGRHTRGIGFIKDQEKRNEALIAGWRVLHCVPEDVESGSVFALVKRAMK